MTQEKNTRNNGCQVRLRSTSTSTREVNILHCETKTGKSHPVPPTKIKEKTHMKNYKKKKKHKRKDQKKP